LVLTLGIFGLSEVGESEDARPFSLTNMRTYIGDDFNIVVAAPPVGYTPA